ncbi:MULTISPECIES: TonB-dependent receptor [unclassified Carboxylicivirga]|uniref:TonB-dependent receptor n=1 Tax=Carboxylicivirga TaxID=1628153 RepID=UPI003D32BACE
MKVSVFLLFLGVLNIYSLPTVSQNTKVSLSLRQATVKQVLNELEAKTEFSFLYNDNLVDVERVVNLEVRDNTMDKILDHIFANTDVQFRIIDQRIILTKKASESFTNVQQAEHRVTGKVIDVTGEPLPGVNVFEKSNPSNGVITGIDGNYSIEVSSADAAISYSYIGFEGQEIEVAGRGTINVTLVEETTGLDEVVVVGYGTQKKANLTGAVGTVKAEAVEKSVNANTVQSLQGKVPGLTIVDYGGAPGNQNLKMRVRGTTTLSNANNPLVLIDGVERSLGDIDPSDIESYNVLKDAASTAIYGSRAAAGVILITTKKGKVSDKVNVNYTYTYTNQKIGNHPKSMGLEDYLNLQLVSYGNNGIDGEAAVKNILDRNSKFDSTDPAYNGDINTIIGAYSALHGKDPYNYPTVHSWYDAMFDDAPMQKHTMAVSGGDTRLNGRLSANYTDQDGIMPVYNFKRTNVSGDVNWNFNRLKMNFKASMLDKKDVRPVSDNMHFLLHGTLWAVPKFPDGSYGGGDKNRNPLLWLEKSGTVEDQVTEYIFNWKGTYEFTDKLNYSLQLSNKDTELTREQFTNKGEYWDPLTGRKISGFDPVHNYYYILKASTRQTELINLVTYDNTFANHGVKAMIGHHDIKHTYDNLEGSRRDFYNNDLRDLGLGANDDTKANNSAFSTWSLRSFFGRLNYNFKERYLFEANMRIDGSSRFAKDNRYGYFPSFSAGWRVSEEDFYEVVRPYVDNLKLRGSWGQVGSQTVGLYSYYPTLNKGTYPFGGELSDAYYQSTDPNENLKWETTTQWNIGVDAGFLENRLSLGFDYWDKLTEGILLRLPIPGVVGLNANYQNAGKVSNKGWELALNLSSKHTSQFQWDVAFNMTDTKNKIEDLVGTGFYETSAEKNYRVNKEGWPVNSLYGYKVNRTYQESDFDANGMLLSHLPVPKDNRVYPGDLMYEDINGDGRITKDGDATFLGTILPRFTYGLNLNGAWKGFDASVFFQGVSDASVALQGALIEGGNWEGFTIDMATDYWTPNNRDARFPRPDKKGNKNTEPSSWWVVDASYLKLKNVQIGYTVPKVYTSKINVDKVRVYVSATNLWYISETKDWGLDPEVLNEYDGRLRFYPQTSQITFGVNVSF